MDKCPQCGYSEVVLPTSTTFHAMEYVNEKTGSKATISSNKEKIEAKDGVWIRSDLYKKPVPATTTVGPAKPAEVKK